MSNSNKVEKITLKPSFREILYEGNEPGTYFDILSYSGNSNQERNLGSIFVLSHLRQKEDDLAYLVSLISSLAKREFYSPQSIQEQDPKIAFERTLKKLNGVMDDFFKNNDFTLNLGLAVIAGENIFISRLGKFKVALARNNEYIDILNNVELFNKNDAKEEKFANIISGKLQSNDKIFAYFPLRSITSREKLLNPVFTGQDQNGFCEKISQVAENADNFACCGIHINIQQIKEIPVELNHGSDAPGYGGALYTAAKTAETVSLDNSSELSSPAPALAVNKANIEKQSEPKIEKLNAIQSEVSVTRRGNIFSSVFSLIAKLISTRSISRNGLNPQGFKYRRLRNFVVVAVLIIASVSAWAFIRKQSSSAGNTALFNQLTESLKIARSDLNQNNSRDARNVLWAALAQIGSANGKNIDTVRTDITNTLDIIDKVSDKKPELFASIADKNIEISKLAVFDNKIFAIDKTGKIYSVANDATSELGQFNSVPQFVFGNSQFLMGYNGTDTVEIMNLKTNKLNAPSTLKNPITSQDVAFYEGNLYLISENTIYKYMDIVADGKKGAIWGTLENGQPVSLTVDGNVYVLTQDAKITKYFKGKKDSDYTLSIEPSANSKIFTDKNSSFIYLTDLAKSRIFIFDKTSGSLQTSYKLDPIGDVTDVFITPDGATWIASKNSIWRIQP